MGSLKQIFCDCQRTAALHPKLLKHLIGIYAKSDLDQFVSSFTSLLKKSLIHGDKQPAVERTLNFVAKFATMKKEKKPQQHEKEEETEEEDAEDEADMFLVNLIQFLLNNHEANSQAVRFRVCQLINKILNNMGEEAVIDDDLYSSIYDTMLHRLQDKIPAVRVQAVLAVARLQDPRNKECPVIKAYRYHLSMDPNPDVRRAVLTSTAITFQTLPDILERTRDVRDTVRREAYKVISQKVHIRSLTIAQRVRLISEGLKDRSDMVRTTVEKNLIQAWLRMVNGNVLDLLSCLDVEASVAEAELALKTLFQDIPFPDLIENFGLTKEERVVSSSELRPESALYWRCLAQHLRDEGAEEALDTVIPELTSFCSYVHEYAMTEVIDNGDAQEMAVQRMEREFVTMQLITMTMLYDLSDEVGRRSLDKLVRNLLVNDKIPESLVKGLVEVFGKLHPPTTRVNQLAEIISEVREPATTKSVVHPISDDEQRKKKIQAARIKVRMNQVRDEIEECVRSLDFSKAQLFKEELEELETEIGLINLDATTTTDDVQVQEERSDPTTLSKCLMIVCHMVENPDITVMTPTLYSLLENLILPCLRSEDPSVRNQGVKALGLFCLLSNELAGQHLVLFLQISKIDVEQIQLSALRCVIDLLHMYGLDEFNEAAGDICDVNEVMKSTVNKTKETKEEEEEEGGVIISALCEMMDSESVEVRTHAAEGLCKLLLACRITSSKLLSHLILMWYNPATEDDSLLRHMLGVFFPLYASFGGTNQESLCAAVLPTLQTLFNAPSRSPLADVDVDDVANFLISITSPSFVSGESTEQVNTHDTLVFTLCTDILANPESSWTKILIRCLTHLVLTSTNYSLLRQVKVLAEKMMKRVRERVCLNGLDRFNTMIVNYLKNAPEETKHEETGASIAEDSINVSGLGVSPNKLSETTMIRKKRMLYNQTCSDLELFSSEADSDAEGSPVKHQARTLSELPLSDDLSDLDLGTPQGKSTQNKDEDPENIVNEESNTVICRPIGDAEIEVSPKVTGDEDTNIKTSKKRSKKMRSPTSGESSEEEIKTPSKIPRTTRTRASNDSGSRMKLGSRRRTKEQSANVNDSSEGEAIVPSKVPRTGSLSDEAIESSTESTESGVQKLPSCDNSQSSSTSDKEISSSLEHTDLTPVTRATPKEISSSENTDLTPATGKNPTRALAFLDQETSELSSDGKTSDSGSHRRSRSTRSTTSSSKSVELTSSTASSVTEDSATPQVRRSARKGSNSAAKVTPSKLTRQLRITVDRIQLPVSQSSTSSSSSTRTSSANTEDVTPVRRSRRIVTSSQSTDSDSEVTPATGRTRSSTSKVTPGTGRTRNSTSKVTPVTGQTRSSTSKVTPGTGRTRNSTSKVTPVTGQTRNSTSKVTPGTGQTRNSTSKKGGKK